MPSWVPAQRPIAASLASRLAWVTMTPLGSLVEPEVYWRNARSSGEVSGARHEAGSPMSSRSVARQRTRGRATDSSQASSNGTYAPVESTADAPESLKMPATRASCCPWSVGSGAGTATDPAYRQPTKAATNAVPGGWSSSTGRPTAPCSRSHEAMPRARRSRPAYVRCSGTDPCPSSGRKTNASRSARASVRSRTTSVNVRGVPRTGVRGVMDAVVMPGRVRERP